MLQKNDAGFCGPQKDHAIHGGNVQSLVEHVNGAQSLQFAGPQLLQRFTTPISASPGKYGRGGQPLTTQPVPGPERVTAGTAEDDGARGGVLLHGRPESLHAVAVLHQFFQPVLIKSPVAPGDLLEVDGIFDPDVVKGHQRVFGDTVSDGCVPCEVVVKQRCNIHAVCTIGCGGESKDEAAVQPRQDAAISRSVGMMHFVNHDIIELLFGQQRQAFRARQFLDGGDGQDAIQFIAVSSKP